MLAKLLMFAVIVGLGACSKHENPNILHENPKILFEGDELRHFLSGRAFASVDRQSHESSV